MKKDSNNNGMKKSKKRRFMLRSKRNNQRAFKKKQKVVQKFDEIDDNLKINQFQRNTEFYSKALYEQESNFAMTKRKQFNKPFVPARPFVETPKKAKEKNVFENSTEFNSGELRLTFGETRIKQTIQKNKQEMVSKSREKNNKQSSNRMRKLRKALEKEDEEKHYRKKRQFGSKREARNRKPPRTNHQFLEEKNETEFDIRTKQFSFGGKQRNYKFTSSQKKMQKHSPNSPSFDNFPVVETAQNSPHQINPAMSHIFFLLSKRFQDSKYKNFFMDQIEVLVFKHGIKDKKIMSLLQNLDLRFDINQLCPRESEDEQEGESPLKRQQAFQKQLEKKYTRENIKNLERMMIIFRADQFYAPIYRAVSKQMLKHSRNFFVNLRRYSKLTPFRKLNSVVKNNVKEKLRNAFSQVLFYVKPNMRLLLLIYVISKAKQKREVDGFRRIYGYHEGFFLDDSQFDGKVAEPEVKMTKRFSMAGGVKCLMNDFMEHIQSNKHIETFSEDEQVNLDEPFIGNDKQNDLLFQKKEDHEMFDELKKIGSDLLINTNFEKKEKLTFRKKEFNEIDLNENIFNHNYTSEKETKVFLEDADKYRDAFINLFNKTQQLSKKNKNKAFISLYEHMMCNMMELEIIESEDCTQEMDDMVGSINAMETAYGNLTGMIPHLAKEKKHIFEEANKYVAKHKIEENFNAATNDAHLFRGSTIFPKQNLGSSQIINRMSTMAPLSQQNNNFYLSPNQGSFSAINNDTMFAKSQILNPSNQMRNNSMYMDSTMNFGSLANSQVFGSSAMKRGGNGHHGNRNKNFKRRQTIRQSVLNQYQRFTSINQGVGNSMISSRTHNGGNQDDIYSVYTKSNISHNRVNM